MSMEIAIHRSVGQKRAVHSETHKQIVGFHGFFEDSDYIYILLELCRRRVSGVKSVEKSTFQNSLFHFQVSFSLLNLFRSSDTVLNNLYSGFQLHFFLIFGVFCLSFVKKLFLVGRN